MAYSIIVLLKSRHYVSVQTWLNATRGMRSGCCQIRSDHEHLTFCRHIACDCFINCKFKSFHQDKYLLKIILFKHIFGCYQVKYNGLFQSMEYRVSLSVPGR